MGLAAETGVRSTRLVRAGFTGSRESLATAFGEVVGELVDPAALVAALDHGRLGLTRNYFKVHSACALTHAAVDAVLAVDAPPAHEIIRIRVETVQNNMKLDRQARPNALSARFSLPYAVAAAVTHRRSDPAAFEYDEVVATLAERVEISVTSDLESQWPAASPARVVFETAGGEIRSEVANPKGFHSEPLTHDDLAAKFSANVGPNADTLWRRLTNLADEPDCATLFAGWR
jgi:2-methylcitrate dehydratase PrpD